MKMMRIENRSLEFHHMLKRKSNGQVYRKFVVSLSCILLNTLLTPKTLHSWPRNIVQNTTCNVQRKAPNSDFVYVQ